MRDFFSELRRRNVYKVAVAYAVVGWLVIQVTATIVPALHLPDGLTTAIVVLTLLGFPVALVIAWAFEMTPEGMKRTGDLLPEEVVPQWSRRKFIAFIAGVSIIAAALLGYQLLKPKSASVPAVEASVAPKSIPQKSIAVLPFENLSDDKSAAYFADGIQDEILTKLASVVDLKVISRTSAAKYKSKPEDLTTVSQQLGVAHVLEGTVQKSGAKVRVNVQLIDARADSHLWAKSYDRDIRDVFAVESEVAQEVADTLQAKLTPAEANTLASAPTKDVAAYDLFLKAEYEERLAESSLEPESFDQAAAWYQQAIARDPTFALAIARLVQSRMQRHWFVEYLSEKELADVRAKAERALAIAPNLSEAHVAFGLFFYFGHRQYDQALAEFQRALDFQPNNFNALALQGYVHRRQGRWAESFTELKKCIEHDPRDPTLPANLGASYLLLRMWKEADEFGRRAIGLDPHDVLGMRIVLLNHLNATGDIKGASQTLATFPPDNRLVQNSVVGTLNSILGERASFFVVARDYTSALKVWEEGGNSLIEQRRQLSARAAIHFLAGNAAAGRTEAEKARPLVEERLREQPADIGALTQMSWVNLVLKRNDDALKAARRAASLLPPDKDALFGLFTLTGMAEIEAQIGETTDALAILRELLSVPAGQTVSIARLKIDPVWDPIRNDPGFQKLLSETELVGPGD